MPELDTQSETDPLNRFSAPVQAWFRSAFPAPTPVQRAAWQAIALGSSCLVIAPTGSGKTLAAFLYAIDALFAERQIATEAGKKAGRMTTRILYLSPVKALAADVERNLRLPLEGVTGQRSRMGAPEISISVGLRSGDTSTAERGKLLRRPPDILITTPESLFLMLTSKARETLRGVTTVILDEVHAVAGSKRGSQLALSLERLDALLPAPAQRIGLSATVRPVGPVAAFLGGSQQTTIVNPASDRQLNMKIIVPVEDMTDISSRPTRPDSAQESGAAGSIWPHVEASILDRVLACRATLVFTNSRGLAEKLTARLNERYAMRLSQAPEASTQAFQYGSRSGGATQSEEETAPVIARSHHGSVSKEQRRVIESALKAGELRCVVATSSLELGIDMGLVDLVIQVGSPPSVASALQRVGRAGHQVGGISSGVIFPRTRRDLVDATVTVNCMLSGQLEAIAPPRNPLDILAQQTIAAVAMDPLHVDDWYSTVRRADPFKTLPRGAFDTTLDMLSGKYPSDAFAQFRPRIVWDRDSGMLTPRPGAQHLAVTSGGTIPDRGMFSVVLPEGEEQAGSRRVGELDEEMVYESRLNDIITLGASSWRIQQITHDQVVVVPAPGRSARLPFWRGEGPGRSAELGESTGAFLRYIEEQMAAKHGLRAVEKVLSRSGLDRYAVQNILALVDEQHQATGVIPTDRTLLIERCRDESGDWRVILHSPWGKRVNSPWGLAVAERIRTDLRLEGSVVASDDGIIARFPDTAGRVPGAELFLFEPEQLQRTVADAVGSSALFAARFRECASRALLLPRRNPGKRSPLWQQRLRAGQLLEVAREYADFPVLIETARECLQDVYDLPALHGVMGRIQQNEIQFAEVTTEVPSPFAAPLLFGYVAEFMYATDAPSAERRASLLALDSGLLGELLGQVDMAGLLDAGVVSVIEQQLQRLTPEYRVASSEGLADLLRELGPLSSGEMNRRFEAEDQTAAECLRVLADARRIIQVTIAGKPCWASVEDAARLRDALGTLLPASVPAAFLEPVSHPLRDLIGRYARTHTLFSTQDVASGFGLGVAVAEAELERLREQGKVLKGNFNLSEDASTAEQWVAQEVFRRMRVRSLQAAREATRPVSQEAWVTSLLMRQGLIGEGIPHQDGVAEGVYTGTNGVARVIEQLAGVALPASQWETQILPARVRDYQPSMLDELLATGEVVWTGEQAVAAHDGLVSLHISEFAAETLPLSVEAAEGTGIQTPLQQAIMKILANGGAYFMRQILVQLEESDPEEVAGAMWQLVWSGYITTDTWAALRALTSPLPTQRGRAAHRVLRSRRGHTHLAAKAPSPRAGPGINSLTGRWSAVIRDTVTPTRRVLAWVENMQDRYGVIARGAAISEQVPGGFPALQPVLRGIEDAGRMLRGRFVQGLGGAQFADNATIEKLRAVADRRPDRLLAVALSAIDPANPFGATLPWPTSLQGVRPTRRSGSLIVICHGRLLLCLVQGGKELLTFTPEKDSDESAAIAALAVALKRDRQLRFTLERVDGKPVGGSPLVPALRAVGFSRVPKGYSWFP